jgi:uncharacterized protein (UPF0548 family)
MSELTYPARLQGLSIPLAQGATFISGPWHVFVQARAIGAGLDDFHLAAQRLASWQMHRDAGIRVAAGTGAAEGAAMGAEVRMQIGAGPFSIAAECRVIAVVDDRREFGFAYGTLPRHPERGEEAFLVSWREDGTVVGSVAAFSQPAEWYTRVGGPLARAAQALAARRYLAAMIRCP